MASVSSSSWVERAGSALGLLLVSCVSPTTIEVPSMGDAQSVLLLAESEGGETSVLALGRASTEEDFESPVLSLEERNRLFMLGYRCPLGKLGLEPGLQKLEEGSGSFASPRLPPPNAGFELVVEGESVSDWSEIVPDDPRVLVTLGKLELAQGAMCRLYGATFSLERMGNLENRLPSFALPLEAGRWLVAPGSLGGASMAFVSASGELEDVTLEATLPSGTSTTVPTEGGLLDESGLIWLFDRGGRTARGTVSGGFEVIDSSGGEVSGPREWFQIDGRGHAETFEAVSAETGLFEHFDGRRWTTLLRDEAVDVTTGASPLISSTGPGEASVVQWGGGASILVLRRGERDRVERLPPIPPDMDEPTRSELPLGLARSGLLGPMLVSGVFEGTRPLGGYLYYRGDDGWVRLENSLIPVAGRRVAEVDPGLFLVAGRGDGELVGVYHLIAGFCGAFQTPSDENIEILSPSGGLDVLMVDEDGLMWMLHRDQPPDPCARPPLAPARDRIPAP